jgi:tetratricopeptide (TPR) repeat protein
MKAPYLVTRYVLNMVAPLQLKVLYSVTQDIGTGMLCLVLWGGAAAAVYYLRKQDEIIFGATWTLLFLLPVINIIPLHTVTVLADRYAYFSLMGCAILLSSAICRLNGRALSITLSSLCLLYGVIGVRNTAAWKNDLTFFSRMTVDAPDSFVGFKNLGMELYRLGEIERALRALETGDSKTDIPVKYLIGNAYIFWKENRLDSAEKSLLRVVSVNTSSPEPYLMLKMISQQKGDHASARMYRDTLQNMVGSIDDMVTQRTFELCRTGETYLSKGQIVDAEMYLWQALRTNPAYVPALIDMGSLRAGQGRPSEAVSYFNRVLDLEPDNASAHYNLALAYEMLGKPVEAMQEMKKSRAPGAGQKPR